MPLSQTSIIFAGLVIGFIVYITARGRLPLYFSFFWTKSQSVASNPLAPNSFFNQSLSALSPGVTTDTTNKISNSFQRYLQQHNPGLLH